MDVLIAHGSGVVRRELARALAERGDALYEAADGVAALELLLREDGPRLALIDWDLPRLEGPELCRLLRDFTLGRPTYIVLLTPAGGGRDVAAGLEAGAHSVASLPVSDADLRARVDFGRQVVGCRGARRRLRRAVAAPGPDDALPGVEDREAIMNRLDAELRARSVKRRRSASPCSTSRASRMRGSVRATRRATPCCAKRLGACARRCGPTTGSGA